MENYTKYTEVSSVIPESVLIDILKVYEFGKEESLDKLPNDFICEQQYGKIWAKWRDIFKIRNEIRKK